MAPKKTVKPEASASSSDTVDHELRELIELTKNLSLEELSQKEEEHTSVAKRALQKTEIFKNQRLSLIAAAKAKAKAMVKLETKAEKEKKLEEMKSSYLNVNIVFPSGETVQMKIKKGKTMATLRELTTITKTQWKKIKLSWDDETFVKSYRTFIYSTTLKDGDTLSLLIPVTSTEDNSESDDVGEGSEDVHQSDMSETDN